MAFRTLQQDTTKTTGFRPLNSSNNETLDSFGSLAKKDIVQKTGDVVNKIFAGKQVGQSIGTLGALAIEKAKGLFGEQDNSQFIDTSAPTPLQVAGDIVKGATEVAGSKLPVATSVLGKVGQFGTLGAISGGAKAVSEGKDTQNIIKDTQKGAVTGAIVGGVTGIAEKGLSKLSDLSTRLGDKIQTSVIKPSQADIKDGWSVDTIKKYGLGGSLKKSFEKTDMVIDDLSKQLNEKLKSSNSSVDLNKVYENTAKRLMGNKLESFGSNTQMENAIEKLRNEIVAVSGNNGLVSIPEAQIVKRASGHFGAWQFGNPTPEATASQKVYNTFYNELKTAIENGSPEGVKEINKEISRLIPIMNSLIKRIPVADRNNTLSLTDIITLSASSLEPRALTLSLLNLASKSGSVGSLLSNTPDLGKQLQKIEPVIRQETSR